MLLEDENLVMINRQLLIIVNDLILKKKLGKSLDLLMNRNVLLLHLFIMINYMLFLVIKMIVNDQILLNYLMKND